MAGGLSAIWGLFLYGGVVVHENVVLRQCRNTGNGISVDIDLDQMEAVRQSVYAGQLVVIHVDVGDIRHLCDAVNGFQGVVGAVNHLHGAVTGEFRQGGNAVVGEVQLLQLAETGDCAQVGNLIVGDGQRCQVGAAG